MGIFNEAGRSLAKLRSRSPRLAQPVRGSHATSHRCEHLEVHTASNMVIITVDQVSAQHIADAARSRIPLRLEAPSAPFIAVHLSPSKREVLPVKDPKRGWVLGLDPVAQEGIANKLAASPGEYEISSRLAFVVVGDQKEGKI